jgi:hypothetical protein
MKSRSHRILSYLFCLLAPWVSTLIIYFAAQEQWIGVIGSTLLTGSMAALGIEGAMTSSSDKIESTRHSSHS